MAGGLFTERLLHDEDRRFIARKDFWAVEK
jgi:hypothetical protein